MKRGLSLPAVLAVTVLAAASVTCGGDSTPEPDAGCELLFCIEDNPTIDAGPTADAAVCGQLICADNGEQCPTGCVPVG
jgi:hypothetical protein